MCTVEGCSRPTPTPGTKLCYAHYTRKRRHGDVGPAEVWDRKSVPCSVEGCGQRKASPLGYCGSHARRFRKTGSTDYVAPPRRWAEENTSWLGADVGYKAAHDRVRTRRGPARDHRCADCGEPARHWSYDHQDPNELLGTSGATTGIPYSADPSHYAPRCVPCHKRFDLNHNSQTGGLLGVKRRRERRLQSVRT